MELFDCKYFHRSPQLGEPNVTIQFRVSSCVKTINPRVNSRLSLSLSAFDNAIVFFFVFFFSFFFSFMLIFFFLWKEIGREKEEERKKKEEGRKKKGGGYAVDDASTGFVSFVMKHSSMCVCVCCYPGSWKTILSAVITLFLLCSQ